MRLASQSNDHLPLLPAEGRRGGPPGLVNVAGWLRPPLEHHLFLFPFFVLSGKCKMLQLKYIFVALAKMSGKYI